MLSEAARRHAEELSAYLRENGDRLTIDADTHGTDVALYPARSEGYYHGRPLALPELEAEMDAAGVDMALVWQNPAATVYPGDTAANEAALLEANRYLAVRTRRFLPAGWTDPRACGVEGAQRIARACVEEFGFAVVKMNPGQNRYPMDSPEVMAVVDEIVRLGATPAFHYGADTPFTPAAGLEAVARRLGDWPVLAVHMGGGGAGYVEAEEQYHASIALGLQYPNIHYVFSALRDTYIAEAIRQYEAAPGEAWRRLLAASDAPYGRMSWNFGGFREMLRENPRRQHYLGGNCARFLVGAYERLLQEHRA